MQVLSLFDRPRFELLRVTLIPIPSLIFPSSHDWSMFVRAAKSRALVLGAVPSSFRLVMFTKYWVLFVPPE